LFSTRIKGVEFGGEEDIGNAQIIMAKELVSHSPNPVKSPILEPESNLPLRSEYD
jgi:hypothetical protein